MTDSRRKSWQSSRVYFVCNDVWDAAVGEELLCECEQEGHIYYSCEKDSTVVGDRKIPCLSDNEHCEIVYYVTSMGVTGVTTQRLVYTS